MNAGTSLLAPPVVVDKPELAPRRSWAPVKVMLVTGFFMPDDLLSFVYLGKRSRTTRRIERARLYPFTQAGQTVARRHADALIKELSPKLPSKASHFWMSVVVTGPLNKPDEVIEAWRLENPHPVRVSYYFD